jgi:hypothetical protein
MDKREARKEFKSRKTPKGIFAIRCAASSEVWVSASDHLDSARNGVWFQLRNGLHQHKRLQSEWNAKGEEAFAYEVLETLDDDVSPLLLKDVLRERQKHWETKLGASGLL